VYDRITVHPELCTFVNFRARTSPTASNENKQASGQQKSNKFKIVKKFFLGRKAMATPYWNGIVTENLCPTFWVAILKLGPPNFAHVLMSTVLWGL